MNLSKDSGEFLENLRLYLLSSGKNEKEIDEVIGELEDHLTEAEKNGKSVEDIIGKTPKEYMGQVANEMSIDFMGLLKFIPILVLGAFSYILLGDALRGELEYSFIELMGYPLIFLVTLLLITGLFKYATSNKISRIKEYVLFGIVGSAPTALFIALIYLDRYYDSPTIQFGDTGNYFAIALSIVVFVGISIWSKTWISIIFPIILLAPEFFINKTNLQDGTKVILTAVIIPACIVIYVLTAMKRSKLKKRD